MVAMLLLLAAGGPRAALAGAEHAPTVDAEQRGALQRIVAQAVGLGFPELSGGRLYQGELTIHWRSAGRTEGKVHDGFHVKLADGGWLVGGVLALRAQDAVAIDAQALKAVDWQRLEHDDSGWLEGGDILELRDDGDCDECLASAGALLAVALSCGVAHVDELAGTVVSDLARAELPWEERTLGMVEERYDPGFWRSMSNLERGAEDQRPRQDAAPALRIALALWFRRQLLPLPAPFTAMPAAQAERAALAIIAAPPPLLAAHLRLMAERARLATVQATPAAGSGPPAPVPVPTALATRLLSWRIGAALQEDEGRVISEAQIALHQASDGPEVRRWMPKAGARLAAWSASRFAPADLAALIALCDRDEVSLWLDQGRPRTLGDQALRAVASIVEIDPRLLAGRAAAAPWTASERHAVAQGLQAWWLAHAGRPLAQLQSDMLPTLPVEAIGHLLVMSERAQRRPLLDRLMAQWASGPPAGGIEGVLGVAAGDPAVAAVVDAWPVAGAQRSLLAAWHACRGDHGQASALLDAAIALPSDAPQGLTAMREALAVCGLDLDAATLRRLQLQLAADPLPEASERLIIACPPCGFFASDVLWDRMQGGVGDSMMSNPGLMLLRTALLAQCLADPRAASPHLRAMASAWYLADGRGKELPPDLRVCDVAAIDAHRVLAWFITDAAREESVTALYCDPATPRAARDAIIAGIIAFIRPDLVQHLQQAKLPLAIPGLTLAAPAGLGDF